MASKSKKIVLQVRGLGREGADGICWMDENLIEIDKRLKGKERMGVIIHEIAHLGFPDASELEILKFEKIAREVLWDAGYRKVELN